MKLGVFQQFLRTWKLQTTMQLATLSVLAATYSVVAMAWLIHGNLERVLTQWGDNIQMSVYLDDGITADQRGSVEAMIGSFQKIDRVEFVSKQSAARRFSEQMSGVASELISDQELGNPLPASFELTMGAGIKTGEHFIDLVRIAEKLQGALGVTDVSYGQGWVENYASVIKSFGTTSWLIVLVLLAGSLFVVGNSIRNSIAQRRDEIEVLELVGATKNQIRLPYILEGILMGALAAVLSVIATYLVFNWQLTIFSDRLTFWSFLQDIQFLKVHQIFMMILFGAGLGAFGSFLCVQQLSSGWTAADAIEDWTDRL